MIEKFDKITTDVNKERALWNWLKFNEKYIQQWYDLDSTGYRLHKALRQNDVCGLDKMSGYMDMIGYELMSDAELYWIMLNPIT